MDDWGISSVRNHTGTYSAWSAQFGVQSSDGSAGQNNSDPSVQRYDANMQADLSIGLQVNGYTSLTLSFWYFSKTENGGGDFLEAWYEAGATQASIFSNRGNGNSWEQVSLPVPTTIDRLMIRFVADGANHNFEGAYVDDILLTGVEDLAPTSSVSALAAFTNQVPYPVPYTAQDNTNASGVAYVELWYRLGGAGAYVRYTTSTNPLGNWTSGSIPFAATLAAGDGAYGLYTIAVDRANNTEAPPTSADASIVIDTTAPVVNFVTPTDGITVGPNEFTAEWQGSDALTRVARYDLTLDTGGVVPAGMATSWTFTNVSEGPHTIVLRAYDQAGNMRESRVSFFVGAVPPAPFPWWVLSVVLAALLGVILFLWWRRRQDEKEGARTKRVEASSKPPEPGPFSSESAPEPPPPEPEHAEEPPTPPPY